MVERNVWPATDPRDSPCDSFGRRPRLLRSQPAHVRSRRSDGSWAGALPSCTMVGSGLNLFDVREGCKLGWGFR